MFKKETMKKLSIVLNEKIFIEYLVKGDNPYGQGTWEQYKSCWAKKEFIKGQEFWAAQANNSENTVKYIVRFTKNLNTSMRIVDRDSVYEITTLQPFNTRDYMIIMCKEVVASG